MGFSQATITGVNPPYYVGATVFLSWTVSAPIGAGWYQIYIDRSLIWFGQSTYASFPIPSDLSRLDVGTVLAGEEQEDFSAELPNAPERRANLQWYGGTFEGSDIAGFYVYGETTPGGGINYSTILATIVAYPSGIYTDGYGLGGFGLGGFGASASSYSWQSDTLTSGNWHFAVAPFDAAGNVGPAMVAMVFIGVPPLEPALFSDGTRLHYAYSSTTHEAVLTWNASPSA